MAQWGGRCGLRVGGRRRPACRPHMRHAHGRPGRRGQPSADCTLSVPDQTVHIQHRVRLVRLRDYPIRYFSQSTVLARRGTEAGRPKLEGSEREAEVPPGGGRGGEVEAQARRPRPIRGGGGARRRLGRVQPGVAGDLRKLVSGSRAVPRRRRRTPSMPPKPCHNYGAQ
jgi:hypothetical protein